MNRCPLCGQFSDSSSCCVCRFNQCNKIDYEKRIRQYEELRNYFDGGKKSWINFMQNNLPTIEQAFNYINDIKKREINTAQEAEQQQKDIVGVLNELYTYFARFHI